MAKTEKRATLRFKANPGNHIVYLEGSGAIRDMSLTGMHVVDRQPLPKGSKITFALRVGTLDIELQGTVARMEYQKGMVIEFAAATRESLRRLKIHISTLGPANREPPER